MIRTTFRRGLIVGLLVGAVVAVVRATQGRRTTPAPAWDPIPGHTPVLVPEPDLDVHVAPGPAPEPQRSPAPKATKAKAKATKATTNRDAVNALQEGPAPTPTPESEAVAPWVEPTMGECPTTHPVKGKLSSRIFHVPGGFNYPRTKADRCYVDPAAAEADGLRRSKR